MSGLLFNKNDDAFEPKSIKSAKNIKCFNCGANPSPTIRADEYRCDYCGSLIITQEKPVIKQFSKSATISCSGTILYLGGFSTFGSYGSGTYDM